MKESEAKTKWIRGRVSEENYHKKYPLDERLNDLSIPEPNSGCILWIGALNDRGYGRIKVHSKFRRAHRIAWELINGAIPEGLVIDHLCRIRSCINPNHMETVTQSINCARGNSDRRTGYNRLTRQS